MAVVVHKTNTRAADPLVSIVLLDWECRERFHTLEWLNRQDVPREQYEIIWVELHNRVLPEAMQQADVVLTCGQKGLYHKHKGYNVGLLQARGAITVVCDSDAVYPPGFVGSVVSAFRDPENFSLRPLVLMYHQRRTDSFFPDDFNDIRQLQDYRWRPLLPNVAAPAACVRTVDAVRFGGFDEDRSLQGYLCGPYELTWRLVNAGLPEIWHDESMATWHFNHPEPLGLNAGMFSWKRWREVRYPHVDHHALTAVDAFSSGRLLPLTENPEVHRRRMALRRIGTPFEEKYACMTGAEGFGSLQLLRLHWALAREAHMRAIVAVAHSLRILRPLRFCWRGLRTVAKRVCSPAKGLDRLLEPVVKLVGAESQPVVRSLAAVGRGLAAVCAKAALAWHAYRRLPAAPRMMLAPALLPLKCAVKPLLGRADRAELGLYKGFRLTRVDQMVHAVPTRHALRSPAEIGGNDPRVLAAADLSAVKLLVDEAAGPLDRTSQETTHLLRGHAAPHADIPAVEEYHGVRIIPFEGRFFGLPEGDTFDPARIRDHQYHACWVGHSVEDVRSQVDQACRHARHSSSAGKEKEDALAPRNPLYRLVTRRSSTGSGKEKLLVLCQRPGKAVTPYLQALRDYDVTLLLPKQRLFPWQQRQTPRDWPTLFYNRPANGPWEVSSSSGERVRVVPAAYDALAVPFVPGEYWKDVEIESLAATLARRLMIVMLDGRLRQYRAEDLHRIQHHKTYLGNMLRHVPRLQGQRVLDVGCNDGLACDLLLSEDPAAVTGVDVLETVGCAYGHPAINYARMDAARLEFGDESFDLAYTIATLEHCRDPYAVLQEMKRVTRRGGCVYAQAAPLYFSPFGHHMFGYFDDYPWIHLRLPIKGILEYCSRRKIDRKIQQVEGRSAEDYVCSMMSADHVNGLTYQEYRLTEFLESPDVEVLSLSRSREGENLLSPAIHRELSDIPYEDLTGHGFELVFRRRERRGGPITCFSSRGTRMSQHVLITGGAGYLGSVLCEHLLDAGHRVTVLDRLYHGQAPLFHLCENPALDFVPGDVRDEALMRRLVKDADVIIPLAAVVGAPACDRDPWLARAVNLDAIKFLNQLRSPRQLVVYPNTNSGYGTRSGASYCTEDTPLEPISLYGRTKCQAEAELLASPNTITLRLATVFGTSPRMRLDLLVNHFVYVAVTDGYIIIFEKDFKRNFVHIRDVADCFLHCIAHAPADDRPALQRGARRGQRVQGRRWRRWCRNTCRGSWSIFRRSASIRTSAITSSRTSGCARPGSRPAARWTTASRS